MNAPHHDERRNGAAMLAARLGAALLVLASGLPAAAQGPVVLPAAKDSCMRGGSANRNEGANPGIVVKPSGPHRGIVAFDFSNVSLDGLVRARLLLTIDAAHPPSGWSGGGAVEVRRVLEGWAEGNGKEVDLPPSQQFQGSGTGVTWKCAIDSAIGNQASDCATFWNGANTAMAPPTAAPATIANGQSGEVAWDVTADVLAGALHGWVVKRTAESGSGHVNFQSREGATPPRLSLEYRDATVPVVSITRPRNGATTNRNDVEAEVVYTDPLPGSGIDPASFVALLDGQPVTSSFTAGASGATGTLSALSLGSHTLSVEIRDLDGNPATAQVTFHVVGGATIHVPSSKDSCIRGGSRNLNEGANRVMRIQSSGPNRGFVAFDLSEIALDDLVRATLVLTIDGGEIPGSWGPAGRRVDVHRLTEDWTEGNGMDLDLPNPEQNRGNGPGVTWSCPTDAEIGNQADDCGDPWDGGTMAPRTAPGALILNGMSGEVMWDVTADVLAGTDFGWIVKKELEGQSGNVRFQTREGTNRPDLVLEFQQGDLRIDVPTPVEDHATNATTLPVQVTYSGAGLVLSSLEILLDEEDATHLFTAGASQADGVLVDLGEGEHTLRATISASDGRTVFVVREFLVDRTVPRVTIQYPAHGARLYDEHVNVLGMVQDVVAGTINQDDVTVSVNGLPAQVSNRSFIFPGLALAPGPNQIQATARDRAGNEASHAIVVERMTVPAAIRVVSGNGPQIGPILTELPEPLAVEVVGPQGPVQGAKVVFRVTHSNGGLGPDDERVVLVETDANGRATVRLTLGSRAGVGVDRVRATAAGYQGEVVFTAIATVVAPDSINVVAGENQRGGVGERLAKPLRAVVTDAGQNPVEGVPVTFTVLAGGGRVDDVVQTEVTTDSDGFAEVWFALGPDPGYDGNLVQATFAGLEKLPATFKASAFVLGDPSATRIRGIVLDNDDEPVANVRLAIKSLEHLSTISDEKGQFTLGGVPVGPLHLIVDAASVPPAGTWADLEFEIQTLPGIDNTLDRPIFILPLAPATGKIVGGTTDQTVTMPGIDGFALTVKANSATFPDGSRVGLVHVTQVHADKVPMPPGSGMQPRLILTVQPPGVRFEPAARFTMPNVDGLAPGTVTEMFSFDHDLGMFVSIGTGSVSEDGLTVRSDDGFGIIEGGWHCAAPQTQQGECGPKPCEICPGEECGCPQGCTAAEKCPCELCLGLGEECPEGCSTCIEPEDGCPCTGTICPEGCRTGQYEGCPEECLPFCPASCRDYPNQTICQNCHEAGSHPCSEPPGCEFCPCEPPCPPHCPGLGCPADCQEPCSLECGFCVAACAPPCPPGCPGPGCDYCLPRESYPPCPAIGGIIPDYPCICLEGCPSDGSCNDIGGCKPPCPNPVFKQGCSDPYDVSCYECPEQEILPPCGCPPGCPPATEEENWKCPFRCQLHEEEPSCTNGCTNYPECECDPCEDENADLVANARPEVRVTLVTRFDAAACGKSDPIEFNLFCDANVTIDIDGRPFYEEFLEAGFHSVPTDSKVIALAQSPTAPFTITAVAGARTDSDTGVIVARTMATDALPLTHPIVKGVDIANGNVIVSDTDLHLPGRGLPLELTRTYTNNTDDPTGSFGIGWTSTYEARLNTYACPEGEGYRFIVQGGEGSGITFFSAGLRGPEFFVQRGYHATMRIEPEFPGSEIVYYVLRTKGGSEYWFSARLMNLEEVLDAKDEQTFGFRPLNLVKIVDTHGNTVAVTHETPGAGSITEVTDTSTLRRLVFHYTEQPKGGFRRVEAVDAVLPDSLGEPMSFRVDYVQDDDGHLLSATRLNPGGVAREMSYTYDQRPGEDANNMVTWTDARGRTRTIDYWDAGELPELPDYMFVSKPNDLVRAIRDADGQPEEQETTFRYPWMEDNVHTVVRDPNENETRYVLNDDGGPKEIEEASNSTDPLTPKRTTSIDWNPNEAAKDAETDGARRRTTFEIDPKTGEITEERIQTGGLTGDYAPVVDFHPSWAPATHPSTLPDVVTSYEIDTDFAKVRRKVDPEGLVTTYNIDPITGEVRDVIKGIDGNGNGGLKTSFVFYPSQVEAPCAQCNGDLERQEDPRGNGPHFFDYDEFGNAEVVEDAAGNRTVSVFDSRSRLRNQKLYAGGTRLVREAIYGYDGLDRKTSEVRIDHTGTSDTLDIASTYELGSDLVDVETVSLAESTGQDYEKDHGYDRLGRLTSILHSDFGGEPVGGQLPDGSFTETFDYDDNDNRVLHVDGNEVRRRTDYDPLNRPRQNVIERTMLPDKVVASWTYDAVGNKRTETDVHGHETTIGYDKLYREVSRKSPLTLREDGQSYKTYESLTAYDLVGNKTKDVDREGSATQRSYDRFHRLDRIQDAVKNQTRYAYDLADNVVREERLGRVGLGSNVASLWVKEHRAPHDPLNRPDVVVTAVTGAGPEGADAEYQTADYEYEDVDRTTTMVDSRQVTTVTTLDGFDRVASIETQARDPQPFPGEETVRVTRRYDALGQLKEEVNGENKATTSYHDALGRLYKVVQPGPDAVTERALFDPNGNVRFSSDRRGVVRELAYDELNRKTLERLVTLTPSGVAWERRVAYDDPTATTTETDARDHDTVTTLDALDRVHTVQDPAGTVTSLHDGVNMRRQIDRRLNTVFYDYDDINRLVATRESRTDGGVDELTVEYQDGERLRIERDRRGFPTHVELDGLGRTLRRVRKGASWVDLDGDPRSELDDVTLEELEYDAQTDLVTLRRTFQDGEARPVLSRFDHRRRLVRSIQGSADPDAEASADWVVMESAYDKRDLLRTVDVGGERKWDYGYDEMGRRTTETQGAGSLLLTTTLTHDGAGNLLTRRDPEGKTTVYVYEELGKLWQVTMPDTGIWSYHYDRERNLAGVWDPEGRLTWTAYDDANRRTDVYQFKTHPKELRVEPDQQGAGVMHTEMVLDANGNVEELTDPKGQVTVRTFDQKERELTSAYLPSAGASPEISVVTEYDPSGNSRVVTQTLGGDPAEVETMAHDHLDRLREKRDIHGVTTAWAYYENGSKRSVADDKTDNETEYVYDAANRLSVVTATPGGPTEYTYTEDNMKDEVRYASGAISSCDYDEADRLLATDTVHGGQTLSRFDYTYDDNGNRLTETQARVGHPVETTNYGNPAAELGAPDSGYDVTGRLKRVTYRVGEGGLEETHAYTYDLAGNRTAEVVTGPGAKDHALVYNGANWLTTVESGGSAVVNYGYDDNGNQTSKVAGGVTTTFVYDLRDDLREILKSDVVGPVETAGYDASGMRIRKVGADGTRKFTWDESAMLVEQGQTEFPGTERAMARWHYGLDAISIVEDPAGGGGTPRFVHHDALGSVTDMTDAGGGLVTRYKYDAWGVFRDDQDGFAFGPGSDGNVDNVNRSTFTGKYYDRESNLFYFHARYYDPDTGRFITRDGFDYGDVTNPPSLHLYVYANANPLMYVDPDGREAIAENLGGQLASGLRNELVERVETNERVTSPPRVLTGDPNQDQTKALMAALMSDERKMDKGVAVALRDKPVVVEEGRAGATMAVAKELAVELRESMSQLLSYYDDGKRFVQRRAGATAYHALGGSRGPNTTSVQVAETASEGIEGSSAVQSGFAFRHQIASSGESLAHEGSGILIDNATWSAVLATPGAAARAMRGTGDLFRGLGLESGILSRGSDDLVTVYRVQPRNEYGIVTGGAFHRAREGGASLVKANAERQRLLRRVASSDPAVRVKALQDAQASGGSSPFISTTFNRAKAEKSLAARLAQGLDYELVVIRGPRSGGMDFEAAFGSLGGRTKPQRLKDATLEEFGIVDLFIPPTGESRSGFFVFDRK